MNSTKFRIKCVLLSAIIVVFLCSTANADTLTDQVDRLFKTWDKPDSSGCALGVIKDGQFIYKRGYGMANLEGSSFLFMRIRIKTIQTVLWSPR